MFLLLSIVIPFGPLSSFDLSHICKDLLLVVALVFLVSKVNMALLGGSDTNTLPFLSITTSFKEELSKAG